jgi:hypothetical protein
MTGPSTEASRFEFVFTPTNKQLSWEKGFIGERLFFGFLSPQPPADSLFFALPGKLCMISARYFDLALLIHLACFCG